MPATAPATSPERTGQVVAALVLVLALLGGGAAFALTGDANGSLGAAPGRGGVPAGLGGGGGGGGSTTQVSPGTRKVRDEFPFPSGARTIKRPEFYSPGTKAYQVDGRLRKVKAFYDRELPGLDISWDPVTSTETIDNGPEMIVSWHGALLKDDDPSFFGSLTIDEDLDGQPAGTVTIGVELP